MHDIFQLLILIILGLLGLTKFQAYKTKDLKKDIQKAQDTAIHKEKEMERLNEVQQKITTIADKEPPKTIEPPESGDIAGRLDRLNRLHERANSRND